MNQREDSDMGIILAAAIVIIGSASMGFKRGQANPDRQ
jgi:hypothetical protein